MIRIANKSEYYELQIDTNLQIGVYELQIGIALWCGIDFIYKL